MALIMQAENFVFPHAFSTRVGGVSTGSFASLNLGLNRGDDPEAVSENWRRFLKEAGIPGEKIVSGKQIHSNIVHVATKEDLHDFTDPHDPIEADGYVTKEKGLPLVIFTADCVPVLMEDSVHEVIGCVHAGWRGAVADIEAEGIRKMQELGAKIQDIRIAIGPAIGKCCFEVGPEVREAILNLLGPEGEQFVTAKENGKYMADLPGAVAERFLQLGVAKDHLEVLPECTMCHPDRFYSHRYMGTARGSQASVICM